MKGTEIRFSGCMKRVGWITIGMNVCKRIDKDQKRSRLKKKFLDFIREDIKACFVDEKIVRYKKL